ncbi:hypothetical protein HYH02_011516 [Chlamydomonas schloesseri]|uniref:Uncharacterized protein n=1 Tax=Chlamydomonas schloesseri TaxID=2026947 RepID=A0A835TA53_9CHLO|nr:hypothetical protein HYH02_011516 [Chlamydomonas schloesseri]|eukprot:KAG2436579.1 hypothetical protein HYH02_011516 [Chlamydomonas schloesseri]
MSDQLEATGRRQGRAEISAAALPPAGPTLGATLGSHGGVRAQPRPRLGTGESIRAILAASRLAVEGTGAILQSVDDVLQFVLPCHTLLTAAQDQAFYRAMRAAIIASLLDKDTGFLNAVIGAGQVEAVLRSGNGVEVVPHGRTGRKKTLKGRKETPKGRKETPKGRKETPKGLRTVRQCLQAAESRAKAKGLGDDIRQLFQYCSGESRQAREELLETELFVRCGEVDEGAGALRLRAGEFKYSAGEMDAADEQLQALFMLAAFTLDKVLAAAAAAAPAGPTARAALVQLPRRFIMDGFCVYAGKASEQQLAAAAEGGSGPPHRGGRIRGWQGQGGPGGRRAAGAIP